MKAYKTLVRNALTAGFTVSVFDGEEWPVKRSANEAEIYAAIEAVDEAQLRIRDAGGNYIGWALVVNGLEDDELVADYSDNETMRKLVGDE